MSATELVDVRMPKLGSGEVGAVIAWHVAEGDAVTAGQLVAEIETEKATVDVEAPVAGTVVELSVELEVEVPVGTPILVVETA